VLWRNVFGKRPDPNGEVIEWLKQNSAPTDEILIHYEDIPVAQRWLKAADIRCTKSSQREKRKTLSELFLLPFEKGSRSAAFAVQRGQR
jgi:hypothetical protein